MIVSDADKRRVLEEFLDRMIEVYARPRGVGENSSRALAEYVDSLAGFDRETLAEGWRRLKTSHDRTTWPTIAECRKACIEARGAAAEKASPLGSAVQPNKVTVEEARRTAAYRRACQQGIGRMFVNHVAFYGKLPTEGEIAKELRAWQRHPALVEDIRANPDKYGFCAPMLLKLGEAIIEMNRKEAASGAA